MQAARKAIPDVAITTDVIAGFPGETEAEFKETLTFVEQMQFTGAHIFTYSARPGTAAASMPNQIHNATRKERNVQLRKLVANSTELYQEQFVGQQLSVLWENMEENHLGGWNLEGLTDNYIRVKAQSSQPLWNQITPTQINAAKTGNLVGSVEGTPPAIWFENTFGGVA